MASSNKDQTMEYDKQLYKKPEKPKNHLAGRVNKFQEKVNQLQTPATPQINSVHEYVFEVDFFFCFVNNQIVFSTFSHHEIESNVLNGIKHVHQLIKDNGQQGDYAIQITFGELIPVSMKLEGLITA
jgi:hypothetical protein